VPESPRWLFVHGQEKEAEEIVDGIEERVREDTGEELPEPEGAIEVRPRKRIRFSEIAHTAISKYPRRTILGLSLFVGQAFLYNAVTFDLGTLLGEFFAVSSGTIPLYIALFAASNFLGPLILGRFFDTVGRRPMVSATYLGSAAITAVLGVFLIDGNLTTWSFMAFVLAIFFLASAGASSAYLTVSEIFPMETRALSIAFFYAVGTGAGGIVGPLLFGHLINTGSQSKVAIGFFVGAVVMAIGGIAEIFFGVDAEQRQLEDIAAPLTATDSGKPPARRGRVRTSPGMPVSEPTFAVGLDREVEIIDRALHERGSANRRELRRRVGARYWGPGRFHAALREAVIEGRARRIRGGEYAPVDRDDDAAAQPQPPTARR
jgi:hypothetical protein